MFSNSLKVSEKRSQQLFLGLARRICSRKHCRGCCCPRRRLTNAENDRYGAKGDNDIMALISCCQFLAPAPKPQNLETGPGRGSPPARHRRRPMNAERTSSTWRGRAPFLALFPLVMLTAVDHCSPSQSQCITCRLVDSAMHSPGAPTEERQQLRLLSGPRRSPAFYLKAALTSLRIVLARRLPASRRHHEGVFPERLCRKSRRGQMRKACAGMNQASRATLLPTERRTTLTFASIALQT